MAESNHRFLQETMVGKRDVRDQGWNENFVLSMGGEKKHFGEPLNNKK